MNMLACNTISRITNASAPLAANTYTQKNNKERTKDEAK
jgi:hypothetical protein